MNHKKLIFVGVISGLVTALTIVLGVAGTVVGSILFSVVYNVLAEGFEDSVSNKSFNPDFEWDIVYVVPLIVIALIQLLLIFALLAEMGILPHIFVNFFLSLQHLTDNNLYRLLGLGLLFISAYPLVLKPGFVKQRHALILVFVGVIFLARGFADLGNAITNMYDAVFVYFDLPIAIIAFLLISYVIVQVLSSSNKNNNSNNSNKSFKPIPVKNRAHVNHEKMNVSKQVYRRDDSSRKNYKKIHNVEFKGNVRHQLNINKKRPHKGFNKSSSEIHFESNDLLDDYKK